MTKTLADRPQLILVGGSNGSGKTTLAMRMIEQYGFRYLGTDAFAKQLNPDDVDKVQVSAGKMFINGIKAAIQNKESIIVESTLAGFTLCEHIKEAKKNGYYVSCVYIYLDTVEISIRRVKLRVSQGGHNVPEVDIRRRFGRSRLNFWNRFRPICHFWELYYNSPEEKEDFIIDHVASSLVSEEKLYDEINITDDVQFKLFLKSIGVNNVSI